VFAVLLVLAQITSASPATAQIGPRGGHISDRSQELAAPVESPLTPVIAEFVKQFDSEGRTGLGKFISSSETLQVHEHFTDGPVKHSVTKLRGMKKFQSWIQKKSGLAYQAKAQTIDCDESCCNLYWEEMGDVPHYLVRACFYGDKRLRELHWESGP
jgi:hypothetical protein